MGTAISPHESPAMTVLKSNKLASITDAMAWSHPLQSLKAPECCCNCLMVSGGFFPAESWGFSFSTWNFKALFETTSSPTDNFRNMFNKTSRHMILVYSGGWTNPFEKYARQIGSFLQLSGWKLNILCWNHDLLVFFSSDIFRKKTKKNEKQNPKNKQKNPKMSSCCNKGCTVSTINMLHTVITRKHKRKDHTKVLAQVAIMVANLCNSRKVRIFRNKRIKPRVFVSCRTSVCEVSQTTHLRGKGGLVEGEKGVFLGWLVERMCIHFLKVT